MGRTVSIGNQSFASLREKGNFLVDKTDFVRQWWESDDSVTLVCRPRRFGKTLNMSMLECFFGTHYAGRGEELFGGLSIWERPEYRALQGTVPVVFASFAACKGSGFGQMRAKMCRVLREACRAHGYLLASSKVEAGTKDFLEGVSDGMGDEVATDCLNQLCSALFQHWGVRPIVLVDEYDTPMQEAWLQGCWDEAVMFQRALFNSTFKTNPSLGRGLITGVTRVSRESIFSDLNNLKVITTTSNDYATCFGFTESEVFAAMDEMGLEDKDKVKFWYDGFSFGGVPGIYNPWSVTNYLDQGRIGLYWANTSGNALVSRLVRTGGGALQNDFEALLSGGAITKTFDEQVVFDELDGNPAAVWSLLLATGYLKVLDYSVYDGTTAKLAITNHETQLCFEKMVRGWFDARETAYNEFTKALLACDLDEANDWLGNLLEGVIGTFDGGSAGGGASAPENFYHGLVLSLLVDLRGRYEVTSNRESGFGRYDVMLAPLRASDPAFVLEFKVHDARRESSLEDTLARAHAQIASRGYSRQLQERGIAPDRIHELAFAFQGKEVLLG